MASTGGDKMNLNVELRGFKELRRKCDGAIKEGGFIAEPWQKATDAIGELGKQGTISTAPIFRGSTIAQMSYKVAKQAMPPWVVVKTTARRDRYAYPRFTNYSPYSSRLRPATRGGGLRRVNPNPNKGWFERGLLRIWPAVPQILNKAAAEIERRWASTQLT